MGSKMNDTQVCKRCNKKLPATLEYFYTHKNMKSGLRSSCKECLRKEQVEYLDKMSPEFRKAMKDAERKRNMATYRGQTRKQHALKF